MGKIIFEYSLYIDNHNTAKPPLMDTSKYRTLKHFQKVEVILETSYTNLKLSTD